MDCVFFFAFFLCLIFPFFANSQFRNKNTTNTEWNLLEKTNNLWCNESQTNKIWKQNITFIILSFLWVCTQKIQKLYCFVLIFKNTNMAKQKKLLTCETLGCWPCMKHVPLLDLLKMIILHPCYNSYYKFSFFPFFFVFSFFFLLFGFLGLQIVFVFQKCKPCRGRICVLAFPLNQQKQAQSHHAKSTATLAKVGCMQYLCYVTKILEILHCKNYLKFSNTPIPKQQSRKTQLAVTQAKKIFFVEEN